MACSCSQQCNLYGLVMVCSVEFSMLQHMIHGKHVRKRYAKGRFASSSCAHHVNTATLVTGLGQCLTGFAGLTARPLVSSYCQKQALQKTFSQRLLIGTKPIHIASLCIDALENMTDLTLYYMSMS